MKTQADYLQHLIDVATGQRWNIPPQKATAWDMAKNYAQLDPYQLADIPALLTAEMRRLNESRTH